MPEENSAAVSPDAVRQQLETMLRSESFRAAGRLTDFLRYVVERTLAGEAAMLKEYVIGTEALGKPADFDPRTDNTVRVTARRVRDRLKEYYQAEGSRDPVEIRVPAPGYVPEFAVRDVRESDDTNRANLLERLLQHLRTVFRTVPARLSAVAVVCLILWLGFTGLRSEELRSSPVVLAGGEAQAMVLDKGFYAQVINEEGGKTRPRHRPSVVKGLPVVVDARYGLMWERDGSYRSMGRSDADTHVGELNRKQAGGFTDWRLPTLEEAMSLMMRPENAQPAETGSAEKKEYLHLSSTFNALSAPYIWTADSAPNNRFWVVYYHDGYPSMESDRMNAHVRAVRTAR